MHPDLAQAESNCRSLCCFYHVVPGQSLSVVYMDLHQSPSQEGAEPTYLVAVFRPQNSTTQLAPQVAHQRKELQQASEPTGANPTV